MYLLYLTERYKCYLDNYFNRYYRGTFEKITLMLPQNSKRRFKCMYIPRYLLLFSAPLVSCKFDPNKRYAKEKIISANMTAIFYLPSLSLSLGLSPFLAFSLSRFRFRASRVLAFIFSPSVNL